MSLTSLPPSTRKLLSSSQVITSVTSVVKELMENALDAGATNVEVKLENNGLNRIEVNDNGYGIAKADVQNVCLRHFTSKINDFSDLCKLQSYGFRGEALNSLCNVAEVTLTTRTAEDNLAMTYSFTENGAVVNAKPSHFSKGTYIVVTNLFRNLPVRKQFLGSRTRSTIELKRVESMVKALAIIHPGLRVVLCHNKCMIWQKSSAPSLRQSLMLGLGHSVVSRMEELTYTHSKFKITLLIPKKHCKDITSLLQSSVDCVMIFFNKRPVRDKKLEKVLARLIGQHFGAQQLGRKYAVSILSVETDPELLDVNLEPNKIKVLYKDEDKLLSEVEKLLSTYYEIGDKSADESAAKRPRLSDGDASGPIFSEPAQNQTVKELGVMEKVSGAVPGSGGLHRTEIVLDENTRRKEKRENEQTKDPESETSSNEIGFGTMKQNRKCLEKGVKVLNNLNSEANRISTDTESEILGMSIKASETEFNRLGLETVMKSSESVNPVTVLGSEVSFTSAQVCEERTPPVELCQDVHFFDKGLSQELINFSDSLLGFDDLNTVNMSNNGCLDTEENVRLRDTVLDEVCVDHKFMENSRTSDKSLEIIENVGDANSVPKADVNSTSFGSKFDIKPLPDSKAIGPLDDVRMNEMEVKPAPAAPQSLWDAVDKSMGLWSMGHLKAANGDIIQGSKVLLPKPNDLNASFESVSSQMGCKEQSAFTKFSREIRPKILLENPGLPFTKVARMLATLWQELSDDERCRYLELAKEERKKPVKGSPGFRSVKEMMTSPKSISKPSVPVRDREEINISVDEIRRRRKRTVKEENCKLSMLLVGQIKSHSAWLYHQDGQLGVVRHWGLHETIIFRRLLVGHSVPVTPLDISLPIHESTLGPDLWNILQSLSRDHNSFTNKTIISSPVIAKNGFVIEITADGPLLTHVASTIRYYGLDELREVLRLWQGHATDSDITQCRSQKVTQYFKSEAVRVARQAPYAMDRPQLMDLMNARDKCGNSCLHYKPLFPVIHTFSSQQ